MTVEEMGRKGYDLTRKEVIELNKVLISEYSKALGSMKKEIKTTFDITLKDVEPEDYITHMRKSSRLTKFKTTINGIFNRLSEKIDDTLIKGSELAFTNNYYRQQFILNWMTNKKIFANVNKAQVEASVFGRVDDAPFTPKYGKLVEDVLEPNRRKIIKKLDTAITQGLIKGNSAVDVAKDIKTVLNTSASNAMRISRTEMMRNMNSGDYSNFLVAQDNGVDIRRQMLSALDIRTREQSGNMDGQIATSEGFLYPDGNRYLIPGNTGNPSWDINDRETVLDLVGDFKQGTRSGKNPITNKSEIMSFKSFNEWMEDNDLTRNKSGIIINK